MPGHEDALLRAGDATLCIERGEAAKLPFERIALEVEDVEATVAAFRGRGVEPEHYDLPSIKTVDGVATLGDLKAAWFKDPAAICSGSLRGSADAGTRGGYPRALRLASAPWVSPSPRRTSRT